MASYSVQKCSPEDYAEACQRVALSLDKPVSFLQAPLYGRLQAANGKEVVYFTLHSDDTLVGCGLAVVYSAPGGLKFLYCPYGPLLAQWDAEIVQALRAFFAPIAAAYGCAFVRLDADEMFSTSVFRPIPGKLARTASLQPRAEWLLDISADSEALWVGFHKHARYNVRLAERAGAEVTVYQPGEAPLETFYSLMQATGERDDFGIFDKAYYQAYLDSLRDNEGFVVLVTIDQKPAAAGLFVMYDEQVHYVFAGSSNDFRKIAPAYTVIWRAIQEAKQRGCTLFNFGGVTDAVKGQDLSGVTGFKKRFGGYRVDHQNPADLIYQPLKYFAFRLYKTIR